MADGKQWYNSPEMGQPKKPAGKPAGGKGKPSKPGMKQSGGRPVSKSGKPAGKNPQAAKHGTKPVSGGKPFAKNLLMSASGLNAAIDDEILNIDFKVVSFECLFVDAMGAEDP